MKVGENRIVPKGISIFSIANQLMFRLERDVIVKVERTTINPNIPFTDYVYVKPQAEIMHTTSTSPSLMDRGTDEWGVFYHQTRPYEIPKPLKKIEIK